MNILYLSMSTGDPSAGPTYTIPNQIKAQSKYDNIFWYNLTKIDDLYLHAKKWKNYSFYHDLDEFPKGRISALPSPFNRPDIIIIEQFYTYAKRVTLIFELLRYNSLYIIIPRGEFMFGAQKRKKYKKILANVFLFNKFARSANAIEYLTEQERVGSLKGRWNKKSIIIPNGIDIPSHIKDHFSNDSICIVYIGRLDPENKGLDLLLKACSKIRTELLNAFCHIDIYGPDTCGAVKDLIGYIKSKKINNIVRFHDAVYGKEKEAVLLSSDIFILPSRHEGHPVAVIEALSYGLPVIVTSGTNMKEQVERYNAGWTAECSHESIACALLEALRSKESYLKKGENAIKLSKLYNWDHIAAESHRVYEDLVSVWKMKEAF